MKRTDLEKSIGNKINNKIKTPGGAVSFNKEVTKIIDKREQRKIDQAKGLVPFAVKLNIDLVQQIQNIAIKEKTGINEVVTSLLNKALEGRE